MLKIFVVLVYLFSFEAQASPELIGGIDAEDGDFPEVVYITNGSSRCSATVIGPRVIMTAAHCVADGGGIKPATFSVQQAAYTARCQQAPLYRDQKEDHDLALCLVDRPLPANYASISGRYLAVGDTVTLSGYGCVKKGGGGGNDGQLRYGTARVTRLPNANDNWFYTLGRTAICFGDSGGPAFRQIDNPATEHHYVEGVNSRGNIDDMSLLTSVHILKSRIFFRDFESNNRVEICGIQKICD